MVTRRRVQIYNDVIPYPKKTYSGSDIKNFLILEGSRIVFTAHIFTIDPGATLTVKVSTSPSVDMPFCEILNLSGTVAGPIKGVISDFHGFIDVALEITGGNAEAAVGFSVYDNALTTRIENAEINVDLNHIAQPGGSYDITRIGDGEDELGIESDGSINVNVLNTTETPGTPVHIFKEDVDVAEAGTATHTYTVPGGGNDFLLKQIIVASSGQGKFILLVGPVGSEVIQTTVFTSIEKPSFTLPLEEAIDVVAGDNVLVRKDNYDCGVQSMYSTIIGSIRA